MHFHRCIIAFVLCLFTASAWAGGKIPKAPEVDLATLDLKDGDIVFQHWLGKLGSVIADVTDSPLSHCGMIVMVTPVSIARNSRLKLMYSTFPARKAEPLYDVTALAGKWSGEYTVKELDPVAAKLEFDEQGKFVAGTINPPDDAKIVIRRLSVEPFHAQREFTARLRDGRGINGRIEARICDEGRRIIGEWRDDEGYLGVFSLERETEDGD